METKTMISRYNRYKCTMMYSYDIFIYPYIVWKFKKLTSAQLACLPFFFSIVLFKGLTLIQIYFCQCYVCSLAKKYSMFSFNLLKFCSMF